MCGSFIKYFSDFVKKAEQFNVLTNGTVAERCLECKYFPRAFFAVLRARFTVVTADMSSFLLLLLLSRYIYINSE